MRGKAEKFNLTRMEYLTIRNLQDNRNFIIKPGSAVVIWDWNDYLNEAEKQLSDKSTCLETNAIEKDLVDLVEESNKIFENLQGKSVIQERGKSYFKFNLKKAINLGKLYLLPKIHKGLSNVPGRPAPGNPYKSHFSNSRRSGVIP